MNNQVDVLRCFGLNQQQDLWCRHPMRTPRARLHQSYQAHGMQTFDKAVLILWGWIGNLKDYDFIICLATGSMGHLFRGSWLIRDKNGPIWYVTSDLYYSRGETIK